MKSRTRGTNANARVYLSGLIITCAHSARRESPPNYNSATNDPWNLVSTAPWLVTWKLNGPLGRVRSIPAGDPTKQSFYTTETRYTPLSLAELLEKRQRCIYTCTNIHTHTHIYMCTYMHTYIRIDTLSPSARLCITSIKAICTREGTRAVARASL